MTLTVEQQHKHQALRTLTAGLDGALIAFSGGIDSSLVARVAAEELGDRALAVTSGSASLKRSDLRLAQELAERWRMRHRVIVTDELDKADYRANPVNRCFHCKTSLYSALSRIARKEGLGVVVNGTNCDDLGDHRPGLQAAEDFAVRSPLVEAGFTKADVRALARHLGLENADKPQAACLSSRFPYGTVIDRERLAQVEQAEEVLAELGFTQFRVRHHDDVARIEVPAEDLHRAVAERELLQQRIRACGYRFVALDLAGFRSGSLNAGVVRVVEVAE